MKHLMRRCLIVTISAWALLSCTAEDAGISVVIGPTTIPRGDAVGAGDITVNNGLFAVAFAVDTAPPWGVARGGIVDIAIFRDGELGYDIASLADFMPNNWSSWPTTYQHVAIENQTADEATIRTERDWGDVVLETTFHIRAGDSRIQIVTSMTNKGKETLDDLHSGYVVWPDGGSLFGMPGLPSLSVGSEEAALGDWSAAYGEHWVLGLHAPYSEIMAYGGRDRYLPHSLEPGDSRSFEAWLQIESDGSLAPLVQTEIDFRQLASGRISGRVESDDGEPVKRPAVVVTRDGVTYAWTVGNDGDYDIKLPTGNYEIYATAKGYAQGKTQNIRVADGGEINIDFDDVRPPGAVHIKVVDEETGRPLDARISIWRDTNPS